MTTRSPLDSAVLCGTCASAAGQFGELSYKMYHDWAGKPR